ISLRLKDSPPSEPRLVDYTIAPETTKAFISSRAEMARIDHRKSDIGQEIRKLENDLNELAIGVARLRTLLEAAQRDKAVANEAFQRATSDLSEAREKEIMKFRADFAYGAICHDLLS